MQVCSFQSSGGHHIRFFESSVSHHLGSLICLASFSSSPQMFSAFCTVVKCLVQMKYKQFSSNLLQHRSDHCTKSAASKVKGVLSTTERYQNHVPLKIIVPYCRFWQAKTLLSSMDTLIWIHMDTEQVHTCPHSCIHWEDVSTKNRHKLVF